MKVYDCFTFFNEFDLLEVRLQELWDVVDYFVISEANMSHSGNPKGFWLEENWGRYSKWHSKIIHIKVDDFPQTENSWVREKFQRDALARGLNDLATDDIVIVSDLDEIPRAEVIELIKEDENNYERYILNCPLYRYRLNYIKIEEVVVNHTIIVTRGRAFTHPEKERDFTHAWIPKPQDADYTYVDHGGWHFSYIGDDENAKHKLRNFAHTEQNIPEIVDVFNINWMIRNKCGPNETQYRERFEYVQMDDYFPKCITDNLEKYKDVIIPNAVFKTTNFYTMD